MAEVPRDYTERNMYSCSVIRSIVNAGSFDVVLFQITLPDLSVRENNSREDQKRQVEVSEDSVIGGYELHDTDLGSSCTCEQQYDHEKSVLDRSALIRLAVEFGVPCRFLCFFFNKSISSPFLLSPISPYN